MAPDLGNQISSFLKANGMQLCRRATACIIHLALYIFIGFGYSLQAAVLVSENFNYSIGSSLAGQNGGTGFSGPWKRDYAGNTDGTIVAPLTFGDYPVSGNAVNLSAVYPGNNYTDDVRPLSANFGSAPQTIWSSYLFSYMVTPGSSPWYVAGVQTSNDGYPNDYRFSSHALSGKNTFGAQNEGSGNEGTDSSATSSQSVTYLIVSEYVSGVATTSCVLTANQYDTIKAMGLTVAALNANSVTTITNNYAFGQATTLQSYLEIFGDTLEQTPR